MTLFEIISQVFGALGLIGTIVGDNQKKKITVLIAFIFANTMYALQYLFLYAWPALAISFIAIARNVTYYQYERKNKSKSYWVLFMFLCICLISAALTYQDLFSLIPICSSIAFTYVLWQKNLRLFRITALLEAIAFFVYDYHVGAWVGMIVTVIESIGALVAIMRLDILKNKEGKNE